MQNLISVYKEYQKALITKETIVNLLNHISFILACMSEDKEYEEYIFKANQDIKNIQTLFSYPYGNNYKILKEDLKKVFTKLKDAMDAVFENVYNYDVKADVITQDDVLKLTFKKFHATDLNPIAPKGKTKVLASTNKKIQEHDVFDFEVM